MPRKSRLFALADYLRGRRTGVTAEELAERFGVTVRTIYRDLDALLVVLGRFATEMRFVPFVDTLGSAIDKVRGALSVGAQRELLGLADSLAFVAVPAAPSRPPVRRAIEEAWFSGRPVRVDWHHGDGRVGKGTFRVTRVLMERGMTVLTCVDVDTNDERHLRLDRIDVAEVVVAAEPS